MGVNPAATSRFCRRTFIETPGTEAPLSDPDFRADTVGERLANPMGKHHAAQALQAAGIAAAPVNGGKDGAESPYLAERGWFTELDHPDIGRVAHESLPFHFSLRASPASSWQPGRPGPSTGRCSRLGCGCAIPRRCR